MMKRHATFLSAALLSFVSVLSYAQAPVPFVNQQLVPDATAPGGAQFTLTVNGTGFVSSSVVKWNGDALVTQFISGTQLTAIVPAEDIAKATTASVTVVTPAPGGGTSNVAFFSVTVSTSNAVFTVASSTPVSCGQSVGVGDFNGDAKLDVAVASSCSDTVSILLGDGSGKLTLAFSIATGHNPYSLAVGDFNGDGKLDLAVANQGSNSVSVLLGDGTGNFALVSSPAVGRRPFSIVAGDFNGDGKLDLAVANYGNNTVSVLLGDGAGNFTRTSSPGVGGYPRAVAVGDFNGDGKLDLATANGGDNNVSILLGNGTGNFTLASSPGAGGSPISIVTGDFNGDGKLDVAVTDQFGGGVSTLLGDGTGNFNLASYTGVYEYPTFMAVGDFTGNGKLDLAFTTSVNFNNGEVPILLGDGTGNFTSVPSPAAVNPWSVAVGDFNGDGRLDLVVADQGNNTAPVVLILLGVQSGGGGPVVNLFPTSLTFGTQLVGTSSGSQQVILTNTGNAPLDITRVVTSANFSQTNNCPRELPPGGTCTANVVFTPRNINTITGTITITDNASNSPQVVALTGTGTMVTLSPSILRFGKQQVGTTSPPQTVTLTNYGPIPVTIFGARFSGAYAHEFREYATTCPRSLPAGGSCTMNITFTPQYQKSNAARLEVNDSGGASPQIVVLRGMGY